jgi:predicted ATPase
LEHILDDCVDFILALLTQAPALTLLVTSRQPVQIRAENIVQVAGFTFASGTDINADQSEAVQFFNKQAKQVWQGFHLATQQKAVVEICQLLDGLPLGLELAATHVATISCQTIAKMVRRNLDVLATTMRDVPARQRSLRAVFAYSWQLLTAPQQQLLQQCAVFQGGFTLSAAEAVIAGISAPTLQGLVAHSLLQQTADGRFQMHDMVRQFVVEKWDNTIEETEQNHAEFYMKWVAKMPAMFAGIQYQQALQETQLEQANLLQAWSWAVAHQQVNLLQQGLGGVQAFHEYQRLFEKSIILFQETYHHLCQQVDITQPLWAELLGQMILMKVRSHLKLQQTELAAQALAEAEKWVDVAQSDKLQVELIIQRADLLIDQSRPEDSGILARQALAEHKPATSPRNHANLQFASGFSYMRQGKNQLASPELLASAALFEEIGDLFGASKALEMVGIAHIHMGQLAQGKQYLLKALDFAEQRQHLDVVTRLHRALGILYSQLGDHSQAIVLFQKRLDFTHQTNSTGDALMEWGNLGLEYILVGQYDLARTAHEKYFTLLQESLPAISLSALFYINDSLLQCRLGDFAKAINQAQQGVQLAEQAGMNSYVAYGLMNEAQGWLGLANYEMAQAKYEAALAIRQELGEMTLAIESYAGLARVALAQADHKGALAQVEKVLAHGDFDGTEEPMLVWLTCYQVLAANGDERAEGVLRQAQALLQARAMQISDEEMRASFLEKVPAHYELTFSP